jgi:hypothetical protein
VIRTEKRIKGILEVCEEMHKFCLKEGMNCEPAEQRAYTRMIIHLNAVFGKYRKQNT